MKTIGWITGEKWPAWWSRIIETLFLGFILKRSRWSI